MAKSAGDSKEPATPSGDKGPLNALKNADATAGGDDGTETGDERSNSPGPKKGGGGGKGKGGKGGGGKK